MFKSVCVFVEIGFVLDVKMHGIFAYTLENQFGSPKEVRFYLRFGYGWLLWSNAHFQVKVIERNTPVEHSTSVAPNARVVGRVII